MVADCASSVICKRWWLYNKRYCKTGIDAPWITESLVLWIKLFLSRFGNRYVGPSFAFEEVQEETCWILLSKAAAAEQSPIDEHSCRMYREADDVNSPWTEKANMCKIAYLPGCNLQGGKKQVEAGRAHLGNPIESSSYFFPGSWQLWKRKSRRISSLLGRSPKKKV